MKTFADRVREVVKNIPEGQTMSYSKVAVYAGSPGAARAVGNIMSCNYDLGVPCHRVVRSDGRVGDYNRGGSQRKRQLLSKEGAI